MSGNPKVVAEISAVDSASATLRAVAKIAQETAKNIERTGQARGPNQLAASFGAATVAGERHIGVLQRMQSIYHGLANSARQMALLAAPIVGAKVLQATRGAVHQGATLQSAEVGLEVAGMGVEDRRALLAQSAELASEFRNVNRSEVIALGKDLRSVLLDPAQVPKLLPDLVRAKAVLDASDTSGKSSEGLGQLTKAAEILGMASNPERFQKFIDANVRALQVSGRSVDANAIFELAKYSKASGATLSDRFKTTTAVSLVQNLGGQTTGQSIDQFVKQIVGGFQGSNHAAAKEFVALGLAKLSDFETSKTGSIKGMKPGRRVAGADLAATDPDLWVELWPKVGDGVNR